MYTKKDENFVWENGNVTFETPTISILYDEETGTILKHGTPSLVNSWYEDVCHIFPSWKMIESSQWNVEELNHVLNCTGSILSFVKKYIVN